MKKTDYFDVLRFIAISMVIVIHVLSGVLTSYPEAMSDMQTKIYIVLRAVMTPGAPIFFMISGALFLDTDREITVKKLFGKNLRRIVLALLIFGSAFSFIELVADSRSVSISYIYQAVLNTLSGNTWAHMWYLYALIVLYALVPILRLIIKHLSSFWYGTVLVILFFITAIMPWILKYNGLPFWGEGIYLFYFVAGCYFHKHFAEGNVVKYISTFVMAGLFASIIITGLINPAFPFDYANPIVVIYTIAIFLFAREWKLSSALMTKLRRIYFPVYLVHTFFINLAYKFLSITPLMLGGYVLIPVFFAVVFALSLVAGFILVKIPFFSKFIL